MAWLWVALGGAVGSVLRYALTRLLPGPWLLPLPTLVANVVGCFVIAVVMGKASSLGDRFESARLLLAVGLCGGLTTTSSLVWEALSYTRSGRPGWAVFYVVATLACAGGACALGLWWSSR